MVQLTSNTAVIDGHRIHFVQAGDGPPLLLLHGWPTHSGLYRDIIPALAERRRVIAMDLPGFGQSDKPADVHYGFSFYDRSLDAVLEAAGVGADDSVGLVIHDLGGPIGLHWARNHTARLRELVVLNTIVFPDFHWFVKLFVASLIIPGAKQLITSPRGVRFSMRWGVTNKAKIAGDVAELYTAPFVDPAGRVALAKTGSQISLKGFERLRATLDYVADARVPALLLHGEEDKVLPDAGRTMARLAKRWPHATRASIPGAGHFLQEDAPDQVAAHVVSFLARGTD